MAAQHAVEEADIRQRIDKVAQAIRTADLEGVKPIYAPEIVSFDIVPPLQHVGAEAKWKTGQTSLRHTSIRSVMRFAASRLPWAMMWPSGTASTGSAATLQNGNSSDYWVRWTACFRKIDGTWLIVHDQVSVPLDGQSGMALRNLEP